MTSFGKSMAIKFHQLKFEKFNEVLIRFRKINSRKYAWQSCQTYDLNDTLTIVSDRCIQMETQYHCQKLLRKNRKNVIFHNKELNVSEFTILTSSAETKYINKNK